MVFETNGIHIRYQRAGTGAPVLLLHGWGGRADSMRPFFNALSACREVFAIDFPGHGESDLPNKPWSVGDYADATFSFIREMGIVGCDVIAHSFGGRVTIKLAARDKTIFRRIVLMGVPGARKRRTPKYYLRIYAYKIGKRIAKLHWASGLLGFLGIDVKARISSAGSEDYRRLPETMRRTFSLIVEENLRPLLRQIQNPTLLIWGEEDDQAPLWIAKVMEKEIPDCGLVTYKNAGHFAYLECFGQFWTVISHFILKEGDR